MNYRQQIGTVVFHKCFWDLHKYRKCQQEAEKQECGRIQKSVFRITLKGKLLYLQQGLSVAQVALKCLVESTLELLIFLPAPFISQVLQL